ncbi:MAG: tetratricopeptide repeat protein [Myxococcota bacterium]
MRAQRLAVRWYAREVPGPRPPRVERAYGRAIRAWSRALERPGPGAELAHLRLGTLLWSERDGEGAAEQLEEALLEGLAGDDAAKAQVVLGDLAFEAGDVAGAAPYYDEAVAAGGPMADYARYKRAWCAYDLDDVEAAAADAVVLAQGDGAIADEARRDLARFVAFTPDADVAVWLGRACGADAACLDAGWADVGRLRD